MKTTKRIFQYFNRNGVYQTGIVANKAEDVAAFIEGLGFKCNEITTEYLSKAFGELDHDSYDFYFRTKGYKTSTLKPTGIGMGYITFGPTEFNTIEEYWADKKARLARYNDICDKILEAARPVCKRLGGESKQKVSIDSRFNAITPNITLWIEWDGYWNRALNIWEYMSDRTIHVDMETLITESGMNIFDELKKLK